MVFKRRDKRSWLRLTLDVVYPKKGWRRAIEYIGHRVKRLPDTPHKISLGFACGVFVSFSPVFGLHFLYAALCAMIVRGNILAAFLGTFVGNPLTFPFIAAISYRMGRAMLGFRKDEAEVVSLKEAMMSGMHGFWHSVKSIFGFGPARWHEVGEFFANVFVPYFVGGIFPGLFAGIICYFLSRPLVAAYQKRRKARLFKIAEKRRAARIAGKPAE